MELLVLNKKYFPRTFQGTWVIPERREAPQKQSAAHKILSYLYSNQAPIRNQANDTDTFYFWQHGKMENTWVSRSVGLGASSVPLTRCVTGGERLHRSEW